MAPGLLFVESSIKDPNTSAEKFNYFYNHEHLPDILAYKQGDLALRYRNVKEDAKYPYLALYSMDDANFLSSGGLEKLVAETGKSKILGNVGPMEVAEFKPRIYEKIQTFEGPSQEKNNGKERGQTIVCVAMKPAAGKDDDFDAWYRKQHLDMLSMCRGYVRTTRYRSLAEGYPPYLALHEYTCAPSELPTDQLLVVTGTEWSRKIIGEARAFERDIFEFLFVAGNAESKL